MPPIKLIAHCKIITVRIWHYFGCTTTSFIEVDLRISLIVFMLTLISSSLLPKGIDYHNHQIGSFQNTFFLVNKIVFR